MTPNLQGLLCKPNLVAVALLTISAKTRYAGKICAMPVVLSTRHDKRGLRTVPMQTQPISYGLAALAGEAIDASDHQEGFALLWR